MKNLNARMVSAMALVIGVCAFGSANAASTWTFGGVDGGNATTSYTASSLGDPTLDVSGAYATNGASNSGFASAWTMNTSTPTATTNNSTLKYYSGGGLGMWSDGNGTPNHAIDNVGTNTEAVVLKFGASVALTSIGLGYVDTDADISLFRYTGAGTPAGSPAFNGTGSTLASMATAGWSLVGNYANMAQDTSNPYNLVNSGNLTSSWWLISAFNSAYGSGNATTDAAAGLTQGNDSFKIYAVAGAKPGNKVPEPTSLALMGIGLLAVVGVRRRNQSAALS